MTRFKKTFSLLTAAAVLALIPGANTLRAEAAPNTYYVKYDVDDNMWRMQINSWTDTDPGRELYYLNEGDDRVKDGDILVVLNNEENETGSATIEINAHLSNLTINRAHAVVNAKGGVDECHVLGDSYTAITGNITDAYVYDNATCTLHSNVTNLRLTATENYNEVETTVTVGGTVSYASTSNTGGILKQYYNFKAGTFHFDHASGLMTDPSNYSTTGNGPASAPAASATTTPASGNTSASSGEYDDVPKTGENNVVVWLFSAAAVCAFASIMLRRQSN